MNLKSWNIEIQSSGLIQIQHVCGLTLRLGHPTITLDQEMPTSNLNPIVEQDAVFHFTDPEEKIEWILEFEASEKKGWHRLRSQVFNRSAAVIRPDIISPFHCHEIEAPATFSHVLQHGRDMCGHTQLLAAEGKIASDGCIGLTDAWGAQALVLGFEDLGAAFTRFDCQLKKGTVTTLEASILSERVPIGPGESMQLPPLLIGADPSLSKLLSEYAELVADQMGFLSGPIQTGWCSWYHYYGTETEEDILRNIDSIQRSPLGKEIRVIQIDDGWNLPENGHAKVWGDWVPGKKFPRGMKSLADDIRSAGFVPGLWLAPFSVSHASRLYREHPDWLIQGDEGPQDCWGEFGLDLTHPEALGFVRETFERVFNEWGFDYVKIDFLIHATHPGKRFRSDVTSAAAFRKALATIREIAKDRFILTCGAPMGPSVGLSDGMRIGNDVSSRWSIAHGIEGWPIGNCCIKSAAIHTIWRHWMQQVWWQNDPDCLMVGRKGSPPERELFRTAFEGRYATEPPYGLSEEEAGFWTRLVWLTGGMTLFSHDLSCLDSDRMKMLESVFPLNEIPVAVLDWYVDPDLVLFKSVSDTRLIGLFNLGDQTLSPEIPSHKFGVESFCGKEKLSGEVLELSRDSFQFPYLPPHSGRVWIRSDNG
ncbi:MAG: alpha-galactosidase [Candidatus Omnitrophica bacterium]|nr:alpha-galactosidase [Candidatus Omnitrophota bacterium]